MKRLLLIPAILFTLFCSAQKYKSTKQATFPDFPKLNYIAVESSVDIWITPAVVTFTGEGRSAKVLIYMPQDSIYNRHNSTTLRTFLASAGDKSVVIGYTTDNNSKLLSVGILYKGTILKLFFID